MLTVESTVDDIQQQFDQMNSNIEKILTMSDIQLRLLSKSLTTCEDLKGFGISESGKYYLSHPTNKKNQPPYEVHCQFHSDGTVETIVKNLNEEHEFESCQEIGCSKMELEYEASDDQLKSLVERSTECEQSISIDCVNSPLKTLNGEKAWWTDLNGKKDIFMLIQTIPIFSTI